MADRSPRQAATDDLTADHAGERERIDTQEPKTGLIRAVDRALSMLSALSVAEVSLTDLASAIDVPLPTAFRLARTLEAASYIARTSSGKYGLGPEVVRLGYLADAGGLARWLIRDAVTSLRDDTGESASFWVRYEAERMCIELAESPHPIRWAGRIGMRSPLFRGAAGKVLVAFCHHNGDERGGPEYSPTARDGDRYHDVMNETPDIRRLGYATSVRETTSDSWGVAAPVVVSGVPLGALAIGAPAARAVSEHRRKLIRSCRETAVAVGEQIEHVVRPLAGAGPASQATRKVR